MTARKVALRVATIGWLLCAGASIAVVAVMHSGDGIFSDRYANPALAGVFSPIVLWCVLPLSLATITLAGVWLNAWVLFVLPAIGAIGALSLFAAFSVGSFFAPAALLLLVAGLIVRVDQGGIWRLASSGLWLLVGAAALLPILASITALHEAISGEPSAAGPSTGIMAFAGSVVLLATSELVHAFYARHKG